MFTRRQIVNLLIPLVLEQILSGLMGIADTMMVTSVGDAAISAVSNVDAINTLPPHHGHHQRDEVHCILWVIVFTLPNGMRAAGDVRYSAIVSALSMWIFRTGGCLLLCRVFHMGLIGVWIA